MGIIFIGFGTDVRVIAQGGFCAISKYFSTAWVSLLALTGLFGGELHLMYLDRAAWDDYQRGGVAYLEGITTSVSA